MQIGVGTRWKTEAYTSVPYGTVRDVGQDDGPDRVRERNHFVLQSVGEVTGSTNFGIKEGCM